jgi:hypothetical protein
MYGHYMVFDIFGGLILLKKFCRVCLFKKLIVFEMVKIHGYCVDFPYARKLKDKVREFNTGNKTGKSSLGFLF